MLDYLWNQRLILIFRVRLVQNVILLLSQAGATEDVPGNPAIVAVGRVDYIFEGIHRKSNERIPVADIDAIIQKLCPISDAIEVGGIFGINYPNTIVYIFQIFAGETIMGVFGIAQIVPAAVVRPKKVRETMDSP